MNPLWLPLAFIVHAGAFTLVLANERFLPNPPPPNQIAWEPGRGWLHNFKNQIIEWFRGDLEYFSKGSCFVICVLALLAIGLGVQ